MARKTDQRDSGLGAVGVLALLILIGSIAAGGWFAYQRTAENQRIRAQNELVRAQQAEFDAQLASGPDASINPFDGIDLGHVQKASSRRSRSGIESRAFSEQARLCGDARWTNAVDLARQAFDLLAEADDLHAEEGLAWREPAQDGMELIQRAHESTEALEADLAAGRAAGALDGVRAVRKSWFDKLRDLNKIL